MPTTSTSVTQHDLAAAADELARNPEQFSDWLCAACAADTVRPAFSKMGEATAEDFRQPSIGSVLVIALDIGQPAGVRAAAMDALRERYLADDDLQALQIHRARQIAEDRAEDERQDERERAELFARVMDYPVMAALSALTIRGAA